MTRKQQIPEHPQEVNVGHKKFTIVRKSLGKEGLYGCVEFNKNEIIIDSTLSLADYKSTLLHEITHVGLDLFGLGDDDEIPLMSNEFLTSITSNMFILLASLNPELFAFIISDE